MAKYPSDYNDILNTMLIAGTLTSLGASSAGVGILNAYTKVDAAKFVGIAERMLVDVEGAAKLTTNEISILNEAIKRFKNGLYSVEKDAEVIASTRQAIAVLRFYDDANLRSVITALSDNNRLRFLNDFGGIGTDEFTQLLKDNPGFINKWVNYTEEEKEFATANQLTSIEIEVINLRFEKLYERPASLYPLLNASTILAKYGQKGLDLVTAVEGEALNLRSIYLTGNERGELVLVSGMIDKDSGATSALYTNFTRTELKSGGAYDQFKNSMHPNLRNRYLQTMAKRGASGEGYNLSNPDDLLFTGTNIASHAEIRALNDLSFQKFGSEVSEFEYDMWLKSVLGYN
jgi:hypothetical protein